MLVKSNPPCDTRLRIESHVQSVRNRNDAICFCSYNNSRVVIRRQETALTSPVYVANRSCCQPINTTSVNENKYTLTGYRFPVFYILLTSSSLPSSIFDPSWKSIRLDAYQLKIIYLKICVLAYLKYHKEPGHCH